MNERIFELARMSGFIVDETGTFPEFAEKTRLDCFAELIVQDCIDNVKTWEKDSRNHISYLLKNHYGVGK